MQTLNKMSVFRLITFSKVIIILGGWVGFTVLSTAIWAFTYFYSPDKTSEMETNYTTIYKKSTIFSTLKQSMNNFSESEIEQITSNTDIQKFGLFNSSNFRVVASIDIPGMNRMATELFFESVPNTMLDVHFPPNFPQNTIPIIIPKNYLNLYNLGFSRTQSLPTISPTLLKTLTFNLDLYGDKKKVQYKGKIVGLTTRYNTILIPNTHLEELNKSISYNTDFNVVKIAIGYDSEKESTILKMLKKNNLESEHENSQLIYVQKTGTILFSSVLLLSFLIISLSSLLIINHNNISIEKKSNYISRCYEMGYHPKQLIGQFIRPSTIESVLIILPSLIFAELIRLQFLQIMVESWALLPFIISSTTTILIGTLLWFFQVRKLRYELSKRYQ